MVWIQSLLLLLLVLIAQSVLEDRRSFKMSIMTGWQFQCASTTCLPIVTVTASNIRRCQIACLAQVHCQAASFQQSFSKCELFAYISNQIDNMMINMETVTMIVMAETRMPPEPTTTSTTTTTTTTTTTSTVNCVSPYVRTPSQTCVNVMIDFYNCGSVGYVCPASYSSCSAGVCSTAPGVQLANAIPICSSATNGAIDDATYNVNLPFSITLYDTTTSSIAVTTNGVLCLESCNGAFSNTALPTTTFSGVTVLAYWDDLYIYSSTSQGIYYGTGGNAPNRTLIFEYYLSHIGASNQFYHFQIVFFEAVLNVVQLKYFDSSDGGATCVIGIQKSVSGPYIQYSYRQSNSVQSNMILVFNTNLGTYTSTTVG